MKKLFKTSTLSILAATLVLSTGVMSSQTAQASNKEVIIGAIIGGVIAKEVYSDKKHHKSYQSRKHNHHVKKQKYHAPKHKYHTPEPEYVDYKRAHVNWCYSNYRTYDVRSNTFKDYDGYLKKCYSPYS